MKVYCQNYFSSHIRQSSLVGCPPETRAYFKCFKLLVDGSVNVRPIFLRISEVVVSEVGRECTYLCSSPFSEFNPTIFKNQKKKKKMASHPEKRITWSKWELFSHSFVPYVPCAQEGSKLNSYVVTLEVQIRARSVARQHYLSKIST